MNLQKYISTAMSDTDLLNLVDGQAKIEVYPNLYKYHSIDELLYPFDGCFLLFCEKPRQGHWVLIHRLPNNHIEFFNSYAGFPDDSLKYISKSFKKQSNQDYPYLSKLLYECPYKIDYNEFKLQKSGMTTQSCGRWCAIRYLLSNLTLKDFAKLFKKNGDELVTWLTMWIIGK